MRGLPPPRRVKRAGAASASDLLADTEEESADCDLHARRRHRADYLAPERGSCSQHRCEQQRGNPQHHELCAHGRRVAMGK